MNKEEIILILKKLESYKINTKGIHWNAEGMTGKAVHLIADEIYGLINEFQDTVAEFFMGVTFDSITPTEFVALGTSNEYETPEDLLISLSDYAVEIHSSMNVDGTLWIGLKSEIETFVAKLVKLRYLSMFK